MVVNLQQFFLKLRSPGSLLILLLASISVHAEFIPPDKTTASTPRYENVQVSYPPGRYIYEINWQGIGVGRAEFAVSPPSAEGKITLEARAQSSGVVKLFYTLKHVSQTSVGTKPFQPIRFSSRQVENSRPTYRLVEYLPDGTMKARFWRPGKFDDHYELKPNNLTLDPLSAGILAASLPLQENGSAKFDVYNGKHRFIITFAIPGKEKITVNGKSYTAWKAIPSVQKLTDTKGEDRLRSAVIWIDDETKQIVKLESKVLIGHVRAELLETLPFDAPEGARGRLSPPEDLSLEDPGLLVDDKK